MAALTVRLGEYNIKQSGETQIFESKAKRVVRHKEFTQQTLVTMGIIVVGISSIYALFSTRTSPSSLWRPRCPKWTM